MIEKKYQHTGNFTLKTSALNDVLLNYTQYFLPNAGLGNGFSKSVEHLFTGLESLRTDTNLTMFNNSKIEPELELKGIPKKGLSMEVVIQNIIKHLGNVPNYSSNYSFLNVIPPSLIPAILAKFACAVINPNLAYESYAGKAVEAERLAISYITEIIGFEPEAALGYFTSGGSASNYWAIRCALEKAFPGWGKKGFKFFAHKEPVIIQSVLGHYTNVNAARLLGVGTENVISVPTTPSFSICLDALQFQMEQAIKQKKQIVSIYLIAGCTDSFGVDDIKTVFEIREQLCQKYNIPKPHLHVDAAVGWIYGMFKGYEFQENPFGFDSETINSIHQINNSYCNLHYADSITVDPHKHGFTSYSSSALIFKNKQDLLLLQKDVEETPYFTEDSFCSFPGAYTPETSRPGDGPLMLLANLYALGYEGYQAIIGYAIQQSNILKLKLQFHFNDSIQILNKNIPGTSTVWRFYPDGVEGEKAYQRELFGSNEEDRIFTLRMNEYNHNLFIKSRAMRNNNSPILGYSHQVILNKCGVPISGWKCIIFHPFVEISSVINYLLATLET